MKVIPFGDRILVKRRVVGEKLGAAGIIIASDHTKETETDLADIVYVPDLSFADRELIDNANAIVSSLTKKAAQGDSEALKALLEYNIFLKIKSLRVGDAVMIGRYVGTTFHDNAGSGNLTLVYGSDIIGRVVE